MKKIIGSNWTKWIALILVAASTVCFAYGTFGMVVRAFVSEYSEGVPEVQYVKEEITKNIALNYGAKLVNDVCIEADKKGEIQSKEVLEQLEGGSLDYYVERDTVYVEDGELKNINEIVYGDIFADSEYDFSMPDLSGCRARYKYGTNIVSLAANEPYWYGGYNYEYIGLVDQKTGIEYPFSCWIYTDGEKEKSLKKHITEEYSEYSFDKSKKSITFYTVHMKLVDGGKAGDTKVFAGGYEDLLPQVNDLVAQYVLIQKSYMPCFVFGLLVLIIAGIFLCIAAGHRKNQEEIVMRKMDHLPYVIYAGAVATLVGLAIAGCYGCCYVMFEQSWLSVRDAVMLMVIMVAGSALLVMALIMSTAVRLKAKQFWRNTLCYYLVKPFCFAGKGVATAGKSMVKGVGSAGKSMANSITNHTKLVTRVGLFLGALSLFQLIVICATQYRPNAEIVLFILYKIIEFAAVFWIVFQLEKLRQGGERVAEGNYGTPIDTYKMLPVLKKHGENINNVSKGIAVAVEEQMKSEHLKTELITNVTHDIKTPLTSIINYVDLIKKENITDETVVEYVEVLDRQSARLKKLIEDLLEASKASTGNIKVNMESCDANVIVTQVLGEYQEKMKQKGLEVVTTLPEKPCNIMADGRHLWRVLDNVLSNIDKYAMENTRVYVSVEPTVNGAKLIFKNVSKYQLNISSDELRERFVRGDSSRNAETEGHGLGLSIAESLTKLMNGTLDLDIDGDLFKVIITLDKR